MAASVQCPLCQMSVACPRLLFTPLTLHLKSSHQVTTSLGLMVSLAGLVEQELTDLTISLSKVTELVSEDSALPCLLCGELVHLEKEVGGDFRVTKVADHLASCHSLVEKMVKLHLILKILAPEKRKEVMEAIILKHGFRTHRYNRFKAGINMEQKLEAQNEDKSKIVHLESKLESLLENGYDAKKRRYKVRSDKGVKNPNKGNPKSPFSNSNVFKKCELCEYKTKSKVHMRRHVRRHTGERPFHCKECEDSFSCSSGLTQHTKRKHTSEMDFVCNVCGKSFKAASDLRQHELRHIENKPKPYSCDVCNHKFSCKANFERHKMVHLPPVKWFECYYDECSKKFKTSSHQRRHIKLHVNQDRNFGCPQCGKKFIESYNVKQHVQLVHDRVKKFICNLCSEDFSKKCDLDHHNETKHSLSLKGSFQCNVCDKFYPHRRALKNHTHNVHVRKAKFNCETCGKIFKYSEHFKRHKVSEMHKNAELKQLCALEAQKEQIC